MASFVPTSRSEPTVPVADVSTILTPYTLTFRNRLLEQAYFNIYESKALLLLRISMVGIMLATVVYGVTRQDTTGTFIPLGMSYWMSLLPLFACTVFIFALTFTRIGKKFFRACTFIYIQILYWSLFLFIVTGVLPYSQTVLPAIPLLLATTIFLARMNSLQASMSAALMFLGECTRFMIVFTFAVNFVAKILLLGFFVILLIWVNGTREIIARLRFWNFKLYQAEILNLQRQESETQRMLSLTLPQALARELQAAADDAELQQVLHDLGRDAVVMVIDIKDYLRAVQTRQVEGSRGGGSRDALNSAPAPSEQNLAVGDDLVPGREDQVELDDQRHEPAVRAL